MLKKQIVAEYIRHRYILKTDALTEPEKRLYNEIMSLSDDNKIYADAIAFLSKCLENYHNEKVIILIDEYDMPLENAYFAGFYDDMSALIRSLMESASKTNESLKFAIITGCLRISKESIFTGYLKAVDTHFDGRKAYLTMAIPNMEVRYIYENSIMQWMNQRVKKMNLNKLHEAVLTGDCEIFQTIVSSQLKSNISYYDENESFYHGFIMGLMGSAEQYRTVSNRETGVGRALD